jgi:hypothetical protein
VSSLRSVLIKDWKNLSFLAGTLGLLKKSVVHQLQGGKAKLYNNTASCSQRNSGVLQANILMRFNKQGLIQPKLSVFAQSMCLLRKTVFVDL